VQELIKKVFEGILEDALIEEIIQFGRYKKVMTNTTIIDIGSELKSIPIVLSGSVKVLREDDQGNELILYYLNGGEACAMSMTCCVHGSKSKFRAKAEEDADLWLIPIHYMDSWLTKYQS
jgi:CRP/FNR family transcriptional regulator